MMMMMMMMKKKKNKKKKNNNNKTKKNNKKRMRKRNRRSWPYYSKGTLGRVRNKISFRHLHLKRFCVHPRSERPPILAVGTTLLEKNCSSAPPAKDNFTLFALGFPGTCLGMTTASNAPLAQESSLDQRSQVRRRLGYRRTQSVLLPWLLLFRRRKGFKPLFMIFTVRWRYSTPA